MFLPCSSSSQGSLEEDSDTRGSGSYRIGSGLSRSSSPGTGVRPPCSPTVYRSWTVPSQVSFGADLEEPVLGLRDLLRSAGLSSFREMIEEWCSNEGAAFLSDMASDDVVEALLEALHGVPGMSVSACQRLCHALQASTSCGNESVTNMGSPACQSCAIPGDIGSSSDFLCTAALSRGQESQGSRGRSAGYGKRCHSESTFIVEERRKAVAQAAVGRLAEQADQLCSTRPAAALRKVW